MRRDTCVPPARSKSHLNHSAAAAASCKVTLIASGAQTTHAAEWWASRRWSCPWLLSGSFLRTPKGLNSSNTPRSFALESGGAVESAIAHVCVSGRVSLWAMCFGMCPSRQQHEAAVHVQGWLMWLCMYLCIAGVWEVCVF